MNKRIENLRQQSLETVPTLSIERALIVTGVYREYEGKVSVPVLRALAFRALCERKTVVIYDGELIAGEKGHKAKSAPTYPELCCHTPEDFRVINNREKVFFRIDEETMKAQEEIIIPYWKGKSMRDKLFGSVSPEWISCYEAGIYTEFMEQRAPGHTVCDGKIYKKGFIDFKNDIENELDKIDYTNDPHAYDKREELRAMAICCDALVILPTVMPLKRNALPLLKKTFPGKMNFFRSLKIAVMYRPINLKISGRHCRCIGLSTFRLLPN